MGVSNCISDNLINGFPGNKCVTEAANFQTLYLSKAHVLETS